MNMIVLAIAFLISIAASIYGITTSVVVIGSIVIKKKVNIGEK